ncbi:hypothetical protein [Metaclostridioides mangenotii]|uniref:hypothetical protein n=1 Tax=Metaclostridioides mangenotii TaxID=1540 RepID=UPI0004885E2D|nr:hypothetical protein [Clostridioides mangenotii]
MIYLGSFKHIEENKYEAPLTAYDVTERAKRRNLTVEEFAKQVLEDKTGIVLETVPEPQEIEGKIAIRCVDLDTRQVYYEYEDVPKSEEDEIEILKKQVADLYFMQMQPQGGTN